MNEEIPKALMPRPENLTASDVLRRQAQWREEYARAWEDMAYHVTNPIMCRIGDLIFEAEGSTIYVSKAPTLPLKAALLAGAAAAVIRNPKVTRRLWK